MKKQTKTGCLMFLLFIFNLSILVFIKIHWGQHAFDIGCVVAALLTFWAGRKFFTGGAL